MERVTEVKLSTGRIISVFDGRLDFGLDPETEERRNDVDEFIMDSALDPESDKIQTLAGVQEKFGEDMIDYAEGVLSGIAVAQSIFMEASLERMLRAAAGNR